MFLIITLPVFLLILGYSFFKIVKSIISKDIAHLKPVLLIWILPACLIVAGLINSPKNVDKTDIVGTYAIDNTFYPGPNANWQRSLFSFVITEDDQFLFYERLADGSFKVIEGEVEYYRNNHPTLFRIVLSDPHKLIDEYPALYRQKFDFYYVFESAFGSMFYRKVSESTANKRIKK